MSEEGSCGPSEVMENMNKNAFNIITQASSTASIFKQEPWDEMDQDSRAYALNSIAHS